MTSITVTASGSGKNASTVTNAAGAYVTVASLFSDNRTEKGACYFTVESSKTDKDGKTIDFADGDIVNFTVVYTDGKSNFVQTVNLTVKGTSDVSAISLYEEGFYQNVNGVSTKKIENTYSEDDMKASPAFKFFIAWPSGKAKSSATVKAYLDGDKNKEISINTATDYGYTEKLSTNGVYDPAKYATRFNGERTVSVNLKNIDIKAGTHTIYVVYSEDGKDYTLTSQKFTLEKDSSKNPTDPVADNIVALDDKTLSAAYTTGSSKDSVATDVAITGTGFDGTKNNSGTFKLEFNNAGFNGARTNVAVQLTVDINKKNNAADSFTITGMKKLFVSAGNPTATNPNTFDISYSGNVVTVTRKQWVSATETKTYYYVFTLKVGNIGHD